MAPKSDPAARIFRIKITLGDVSPSVWRRVEIEDCSLETLHGVLQDAMGWANYHLYEFRIDGLAYTHPKAVDEDNRNAADMTLGQLVDGKHTTLDYVYDLGDEWKHQIEVESVAAREADVHYPRCIEGEQACPPEDCGGPTGYATMLKVLKDPNHEDFDDVFERAGEKFNAEAFDPGRVNRIWATWDFSDPKSGPSYDADQEETPREADERRAKAKAKAKAEADAKSAAQAHVGRNDPCPCGSGKKYKKCCFKKGKDGNFDDE